MGVDSPTELLLNRLRSGQRAMAEWQGGELESSELTELRGFAPVGVVAHAWDDPQLRSRTTIGHGLVQGHKLMIPSPSHKGKR